MMKITFLGSGTSSGVPTVACTCATCTSTDPRDNRLRPSIWIRKGEESIVIDTSSDFRQQCMRACIMSLDAVIYTHHHFDHIAGFDDLRAYNFKMRQPVPIYVMPETLSNLKHVFSYAFGENLTLGSSVPLVDVRTILDEPFTVGSLECIPLHLHHGSMRVNGYRMGSFAYCTDCNSITDEAKERLKGVRTLVLDALRISRHSTHFSLDEAIEAAAEIGAERTYFTHIAHEIKHAEIEPVLPKGMYLAYDGLEISIDD